MSDMEFHGNSESAVLSLQIDRNARNGVFDSKNRSNCVLGSEEGTRRLETLIKLKLFNSSSYLSISLSLSCSSSSSSIRAFRYHPLVETRKTASRRAIRGSRIFVNSTPSPRLLLRGGITA